MNLTNIKDIKISKKKQTFLVGEKLKDYLIGYDRYYQMPINYEDLLRFNEAMPVLDSKGKDTFWASVFYEPSEMNELQDGLKRMYVRLKSDGSDMARDHLVIDSIDFCTFGNSKPFRIRVKNTFNDNHDYFYVKLSDASRVYGLELEHILSPDYINFLIQDNTLIEEHTVGIPGDAFLEKNRFVEENYIRLAKEFVKFNERCFLRLLGDQRSYNFVVVRTPDFDQTQYRIRSIDFDQQSYEGRLNLYRPQFFKENLSYVKMVKFCLDEDSIEQYQHEERALVAKRMIAEEHRYKNLMQVMKEDTISTPEKTKTLKTELQKTLNLKELTKCESMGEIIETSLAFNLKNYKITSI
jgi:hypothetical protein